MDTNRLTILIGKTFNLQLSTFNFALPLPCEKAPSYHSNFYIPDDVVRYCYGSALLYGAAGRG